MSVVVDCERRESRLWLGSFACWLGRLTTPLTANTSLRDGERPCSAAAAPRSTWPSARAVSSMWSSAGATADAGAGDRAPADLLLSLLVTITETLHLEEVGDPYMTLRTHAASSARGRAAPDASCERIGAVRVWQPPSLNRARSPAIEKLVYLHLHTELIAVQWIFAFSAEPSLVPHFGV